LAKIGSLGNVPTHTMRAYPVDEMTQALKKMP
jgi:uncharacterized protein with GYD domain